MAVAAWVGGLAVVIALAILGGGAADGDGRPAVAVASTDPGPRTVTATVAPTPFVRPAEARATLRHFVVRGRVARAAGDVWLMLTDQRGSPVATARLDPTGHGHGDWVPFESRLPVMRSPRNVGAPLYVATVDPTGAPVDGSRHRYSTSLFLVVGSDGRATSDPTGPVAAAPRGYPSSSAVSVFGRAREGISLDRPQLADARVTTPDLVVSGELGRRVADVEVALVADDGSMIAVASTAPTIAPRTGWHDPPDRFSVRLLLPDPRPSGPASVRVTTRDLDDQAVDTLTTPVRIEPLERRSVGADGLVGGIVFDVPFDERTRP